MQPIAAEAETTVAIAALIKLVNLLGAELLVGKYREDVDVFEQAVRAKLFANVEGISPDETAAGVALAHRLIEPVLRDLRERVRQMAATAPFAEIPEASRTIN